MATIGPKKLTIGSFLASVFSNLAGGIAGTLTISSIIIFGSSLLSQESEKPLSLFLVILVVLLGTIVTNMVIALLSGFLNNEKYPHYLTLLSQVFIFNIILFVISLPIYALISALALDTYSLSITAVFHLLISIQGSKLLMELLSNNEYKIVSVYGVILGTLFSFTVVLLMYILEQKTFILFVVTPLITLSIELFRSLADIIYYFYYRFYGIDSLNSNTVLDEDDLENEA